MCSRLIDLSIAQTRAFAYLRFTAQDAAACSPMAWAWLVWQLDMFAFEKAL
jgi:hypothetical protein